ncbi:hypothetical protein Drorol1_Dr00005893 [Drosera rotundifolia]
MGTPSSTAFFLASQGFSREPSGELHHQPLVFLPFKASVAVTLAAQPRRTTNLRIYSCHLQTGHLRPLSAVTVGLVCTAGCFSSHLAKFWMVEPEIVFADLEDDMNCAEAYVKYMCQWLLDNCLDDMEFMAKNFDKASIESLKMVASTPFERISYTKAISLLENVKDKKFDNKVEWGIDLASEHERYLTEILFKKPVIVYNYPKGIKAFYTQLNNDEKTVAAMNVLVPKVGELIGGSQREERLEVIEKRILDIYGIASRTI